jgi:hypothetical protein
MSETRIFQVRTDVHCGTSRKHLRSLAITLISLLTVQAMGTQQTQDKLKYNGQKYDFGGNGNFPLESYFRSCPKEVKTKWHNLFLAKNSDGKTFHLPPTNCYRGYVASWTIETNMLVLTAIRVDLRSEKMESVDVLKPIFGDQIKDGKLYALWFDGHITLDGIHEILFFEKGRLTQRKTFQEHNEMFRTDGDLQVSERKTREKNQQGDQQKADKQQKQSGSPDTLQEGPKPEIKTPDLKSPVAPPATSQPQGKEQNSQLP